MTEADKDDLFYVCSLVEFIARKTKNKRGVVANKRGVVANKLGVSGFAKQLKDAQVNHCLSFEQVGEEVVEQYKIPQGDFESVENCKYDIPSYTDIGNLYCIMVLDCANDGNEIETAIKIFASPISDYISNFNSDCYYQNPSYLEESFKAGKLL